MVVGIANAIDLTERALPALKLRGCRPTLLTFPAYSAAEVRGRHTAQEAALHRPAPRRPWRAWRDAACGALEEWQGPPAVLVKHPRCAWVHGWRPVEHD